MGDPTREASNRAYQETMTQMLVVACCVCIPLIPLSLLMKNYKLDEMDQHVRGTVIGGHRDSIDESETQPFVRSTSFWSYSEPPPLASLRPQPSHCKLR